MYPSFYLCLDVILENSPLANSIRLIISESVVPSLICCPKYTNFHTRSTWLESTVRQYPRTWARCVTVLLFLQKRTYNFQLDIMVLGGAALLTCNYLWHLHHKSSSVPTVSYNVTCVGCVAPKDWIVYGDNASIEFKGINKTRFLTGDVHNARWTHILYCW